MCTRPARSQWLHSGQGEFTDREQQSKLTDSSCLTAQGLPVRHRFFSRRIKGRSSDVVSYLLALSLILCSQENSDGIQAFRYATYYTVMHCTAMQHVCGDAEVNSQSYKSAAHSVMVVDYTIYGCVCTLRCFHNDAIAKRCHFSERVPVVK